MGKAVFIAKPDSGGPEEVRRRLQGKPFSWAYLGQSIASYYRAKGVLDGLGEQLDTASRFHEAAETLREPYLGFLYGLGRDLKSLRWWITSLSCRDGYISKTFHESCYLRVALDLASNWEGPVPLVVIVESRPVRRALQRNLAEYDERVELRILSPSRISPCQPIFDVASLVAHRVSFFLRHAYRIFESRRLIPRPHAPIDETTLIISWATQVNIHKGGTFHKSFFGDLDDRLVENGRRVTIMPMISPDLGYKEAIRALKGTAFPLMIPHRYLSYMDLIRTVISSCRRPPVPSRRFSFGGLDIDHLAREELRRDWISNRAAETLLMPILVRRWAGLGFRIARTIYVYENQPWERALCWEARRSLPGTRLVGYQHARVPRLLLNFYLAQGEEGDAPLPHQVVTVGEHSARLLSSDGYTGDRVRVGGALHMQDLLELRLRSKASGNTGNSNTLLVVPSNGLEEAAELIDAAMRLFDEKDNIRVILKCHPIMPFQKAAGTFTTSIPSHVELSEEPVTELMLRSSIIVYSGSTVCVQALALGLPAIHLRTKFDLDLDPLETVPDARLEATDLDELRQQVRWLLDHREQYVAQHREQWDNLVEEIYGPVTEDTYSAFLA